MRKCGIVVAVFLVWCFCAVCWQLVQGIMHWSFVCLVEWLTGGSVLLANWWIPQLLCLAILADLILAIFADSVFDLLYLVELLCSANIVWCAFGYSCRAVSKGCVG